MKAAPWLAVLLTACAADPGLSVPADPVAVLDAAAARLGADDPAGALWLLDRVDPDVLVGEDAARHDLLRGAALFGTGRAWKGYVQIRDFVEDHRFSAWTGQVENLHHQLGAWLIQSDAGFWIFQSDRDDGELVLLEFVERFPTSRHTADALRLLGDSAFEQDDWAIARRRFEQILSDHPTSEWAPLARFRIAQTAFRDLVGPAYDLRAMRLARNELRDYLATAPERPEFRAEAERALATVEDWIATRHWLDADFYRTVDSPRGEQVHLRILLEECPEHETAPRARVRLATLDAVVAALEARR